MDLVRIINEIVQDSVDATSDYPGWDSQIIVILKVKQQAAKEFPIALAKRINQAIEEGISDARTQAEAQINPPKSAEDAVDQGDFVRQRVLQNFEEMESRIAGSYEAKPDDPNPYSFEQ
jgi:hypothetical protein